MYFKQVAIQRSGNLPTAYCFAKSNDMEKIVEQTLLYDFYGELLTEHQREVYEDVVLGDLGYSEAAQEYGVSSGVAEKAAAVQEATAFLPDYAFSGSDAPVGTSVSGVVGSALVAGVAVLICVVGGFFRKRKVG